ncbi:hypothetical protein ACFLVQ_01150, partial [Chloroflexota bacterium]
GSYFADADASFIFTPFRADVQQAMESLRKVMAIPANRLFLGHFGICEKPQEILQRALNRIQRLLDIGAECLAEGKTKEIAPRVIASVMPEVEKIGMARDESLYNYLSQELIPSMSTVFANYYLEQSQKQ